MLDRFRSKVSDVLLRTKMTFRGGGDAHDCDEDQNDNCLVKWYLWTWFEPYSVICVCGLCSVSASQIMLQLTPSFSCRLIGRISWHPPNWMYTRWMLTDVMLTLPFIWWLLVRASCWSWNTCSPWSHSHAAANDKILDPGSVVGSADAVNT